MLKKTNKIRCDPKSWRQVGADIYFIDWKQPDFPLYEWKIIKDNGDWFFVVTVINKWKSANKDPMTLTIEWSRLSRGKS